MNSLELIKLDQNWRRTVIKIGSSLIAPDERGCSTKYLLALADYIHHALHQGKQIVLVSSGSVAAGAGLSRVNLRQSISIPQKQALAAIGQSRVMQHWQKLFDDTCAQILLTRADLENSQRVINARNTVNTLLEMGAIPIINENDSVVVDELVVGDNDNLAAQVAKMCNADRLVICSDVDGLYDSDPGSNLQAKLIRQVEEIDQNLLDCAEATQNPIATGGMQTKLQAAQFATSVGIDTMIINGRKATSFENLKEERLTGTLFSAIENAEKIS